MTTPATAIKGEVRVFIDVQSSKISPCTKRVEAPPVQTIPSRSVWR
jgi:hypothetical protein